MRKQTKLVAVLSAAALLAIGASMTSFAAGWEKDDSGIWHYYDRDDEMVESEWRKDGGKWFYLNEDGEMAADQWVDDDYYVGEDGAMLINQWKKTTATDEINDPDEDGEHWYYFGSRGKKVTDETKKIGGKTYYFDEDGKMYDGWYEKNGDIYYLGDEDEGWRIENQWLWLERPGNSDEDHDAAANVMSCTDSSSDICDEEGWYWFGSNGKMYRDLSKKRINGKVYFFNNHGQMLYEWINGAKISGVDPADRTAASKSNAQLDGQIPSASASSALANYMLYSNSVEEGWRADGWYEIAGSEDTKTDNDTDWYYFKDGKAKKSDLYDVSVRAKKDTVPVVDDNGGTISVAKIRVTSSKGKKEFAFNEMGQMQTGLQYIPNDKAFYFFDASGYMKTGKVTNVECDDDTYDFYFNTTNGKNGQGFSGEKSGYLYFNGKKLIADDDYRLYFYNDKVYLVNTKGKIQKSKRSYDIENSGIDQDKVTVTFGSGDTVKQIEYVDSTGTRHVYTAKELLAMTLDADENGIFDRALDVDEGKYSDKWVSIPFIQLYDDNIYTYDFTGTTLVSGGADIASLSAGENWYDVNQTTPGWK